MKRIQVLLSTYNGEKYLEEQIQSLDNQIEVSVDILVRDDGSTDSTVEMLNRWKQEGVLQYYKGENKKPAGSFMDLISHASDTDYYAFCDQDDFWEKNKLITAVEMIEDYADQPALYFSKAQLVDEDLNPIEFNNYPKGVLTLGHALIENNAAGCTMVFNKHLLDAVKKYKPDFIPMHDHWIYLICLAIGGKVVYDSNSHIKYRQHASNVIGGGTNFVKRYKKKFSMLLNRTKIKSKTTIELKKGYYDLMPDENKYIIDIIANYEQSLKKKWELVANKDIKTDKLEKNFFFIIAVLFNAF